MTTEWLEGLITELRKFGSEATRVEVKAASGGLPASARESLAAFCNSPGGGTLILGLDDTPGFQPVGRLDARKLQADLAAMCRDDLTPPLQPDIFIGDVDGSPVVVAQVFELPREQKPCYITTGSQPRRLHQSGRFGQTSYGRGSTSTDCRARAARI